MDRASQWNGLNEGPTVTIMPRFLFDTTALESPLDLLTHFTDADLASACRSTVPLLTLVKDDWNTFADVLGQCGISGAADVAFERTVPSRSAGERPSYTDAMVTSATNVLAVEAKWTEPRYGTVRERLKPDPEVEDREAAEARNRIYVDGWLEHMRPFATRLLVLDDFNDCIYQMVHRAASACGACGPGQTPALAYLHFHCDALPKCAAKGTMTPPYLKDLGYLHQLLGRPAAFAFYLVEVEIRPTEAFRAIERLRKGEAETGRAVKEALKGKILFEFDAQTVQSIR